MPIFGLSKAFEVRRGLKVFLNLQAGYTRDGVPDPWHGGTRPKLLREKNQEIQRLKGRLAEQNETVLRLRDEIGMTEDPAGVAPVADAEAGALPDFAIIGAARCGTSRFYSLLTKHPHIKRAASKELHFFDRPARAGEGLAAYRGCFPAPERRDGRWTITGEATPIYLYDPTVPQQMARAVPEARLIVLLRNPVDRTYSHYHKARRGGGETRSFRETVEAEVARLADAETAGRGLLPTGDEDPRETRLARSIYVDQIQRWREFYPEDRMLVLRSEDFFKDIAGVLGETQDFLGLPRREIQVPTKKTTGSTGYEYGPMEPDVRERLEEFFAPHNQRLYDYLGRDFGW